MAPDHDTVHVAATAALMRTAPQGVVAYELNGPFGFDALARFKDTLDSIGERPRVIVLRMGRVQTIDDRDLHTLTDIVRRLRRENTRVILCEVHAQPRWAIQRCIIVGDVAEKNVTDSLAAAVVLAREYVEAAGVGEATATSRH